MRGSNATPKMVGSRSVRESSMRRREFIAAIGGAAAAWPIRARAQRRTVPVIGILFEQSEKASQFLRVAWLQGLGEQGFVEGRSVEILYRYAQDRFDQLPVLAADLARRRVAVIGCAGLPAALAAKSATADIPIVFTTDADPVKNGLVASLNRPGGNITGNTGLGEELTGKRLELLHEIAPAAKSIGFFFNGASALSLPEMREAEIACSRPRRSAGGRGRAQQIEVAFRTLAEERIGDIVSRGNHSAHRLSRPQRHSCDLHQSRDGRGRRSHERRPKCN